MIVVYTGNGKGKTSACVGQALRAHGQGLRVAFVQFMKREAQAGEQIVLAELLKPQYFAGGKGFFRAERDREEHRAAARESLVFAHNVLGTIDMLVLDESLYALNAGLITQKELNKLLDDACTRTIHVVLSGRGLPDWLAERADMITEMTEIKHPWHKGIAATKGIEY